MFRSVIGRLVVPLTHRRAGGLRVIASSVAVSIVCATAPAQPAADSNVATVPAAAAPPSIGPPTFETVTLSEAAVQSQAAFSVFAPSEMDDSKANRFALIDTIVNGNLWKLYKAARQTGITHQYTSDIYENWCIAARGLIGVSFLAIAAPFVRGVAKSFFPAMKPAALVDGILDALVRYRLGWASGLIGGVLLFRWNSDDRNRYHHMSKQWRLLERKAEGLYTDVLNDAEKLEIPAPDVMSRLDALYKQKIRLDRFELGATNDEHFAIVSDFKESKDWKSEQEAKRDKRLAAVRPLVRSTQSLSVRVDEPQSAVLRREGRRAVYVEVMQPLTLMMRESSLEYHAFFVQSNAGGIEKRRWDRYNVWASIVSLLPDGVVAEAAAGASAGAVVVSKVAPTVLQRWRAFKTSPAWKTTVLGITLGSMGFQAFCTIKSETGESQEREHCNGAHEWMELFTRCNTFRDQLLFEYETATLSVHDVRRKMKQLTDYRKQLFDDIKDKALICADDQTRINSANQNVDKAEPIFQARLKATIARVAAAEATKDTPNKL